MRIASVCLAIACATGSCDIEDDRHDELIAMQVARSSDELQAIQQLYDLIAAADKLRDRPNVTATQRIALDAATAATRKAIAAYVERRQQGQMRGAVIARIGQASSVIVADNVTGIGVSDDWLLVFCGVAALAAVIVYDARATPGQVDAAWEAVGERLLDLKAALSAVMAATAATATTDQCKDSTATASQPQPLPLPAERSTVD